MTHMEGQRYFKVARPDGFDFHTGKTINYRESIGKVVAVPNGYGKDSPFLCSPTVIHASKKAIDAEAHSERDSAQEGKA